GANGTVGLASFDFVGYKIPAQAFINATEGDGGEPPPFFGLVGLGFDGPDDPIPRGLSAANFTNGSEVGKSVLTNIFNLYPDIPRFFALSLPRDGDQGASGDGSFAIGAYDDRYSEVQHAPLLPQFPENSGSWSILTDGIFVNGSKIAWAVDPSANITAGKAKGLLDTGTALIYLPRDVQDSAYSTIPGAVQTTQNSSLFETAWVVPCGTAIDLQIGFGGETFRVHPLDLSELHVVLGPNGKNYTVCKGLILPNDDGRDAIFGDVFLRNVYTVFGFGNETTGGAYIQLLSLTNETSMTDYSNMRSPLLAGGPPELSPVDLVQLFDGPSSSAAEESTTASSTTSSSTSTTTSATSSSSPSTTSPSTTSPSATAASTASSSTSQSGDVIAGDLAAAASVPTPSTDSKAPGYGPIMIGLLGANLAILLFLLYLGVSALVKHDRTVGSPRRTREAKYAPVKLGEDI
ncbi:aspartic peptidase domain-containing protein, partial [Mycena polygramma]